MIISSIMIAMEAHIYAYYLHLAKGRMSDAARLMGINPNTFTRKAHLYTVEFRNFRGAMCECRRGEKTGTRCKICAEKNRIAARNRYHVRKGKQEAPPKDNVGKTAKMLFLSAKMSALQRFMQLSK